MAEALRMGGLQNEEVNAGEDQRKVEAMDGSSPELQEEKSFSPKEEKSKSMKEVSFDSGGQEEAMEDREKSREFSGEEGQDELDQNDSSDLEPEREMKGKESGFENNESGLGSGELEEE